jgi:hypothetical protein
MADTLGDFIQTYPEKTVPTAGSESVIGTATTTSAPVAPPSTVEKAGFIGILLQAPDTNTASVFVGAEGVTVANGLAIAPGKTLFIPLRGAGPVHCIAVAAQKLRVMKVL